MQHFEMKDDATKKVYNRGILKTKFYISFKKVKFKTWNFTKKKKPNSFPTGNCLYLGWKTMTDFLIVKGKTRENSKRK